jgi:hypothetical protein
MAKTQLNAQVPQELAAEVRAAAARAGMGLSDYITEVLAADLAAASGSRELREARARMHAMAAYRRWNTAGRSEKGALTMAEVFGE